MKTNSVIWKKLGIEWPVFMFLLVGLAALTCSTGCQTARTQQAQAVAAVKAGHSEPIVLKEGDVLKISFPGAPNLDTTAQIQRDGKIALPLGGEMDSAGKTVEQLEKELSEHYASQLVSKEVNVSIQSSSFPIFVTGAVLKPGKVLADHPMTVLEAVMEAGGFDYATANLKAIKIIRENPAANYTLNFKGLFQGRPVESFYLKPYDIVYVPTKFSWF